MSETIVRDATFLDLSQMAYLAHKLWDFETNELGCQQFDETKKNLIIDVLSKVLVCPDSCKIIVVERNRKLRGLFILEVIQQSIFKKHKRVCNVWMGISNKSGVYIKRLQKMGNEWAAEKGCTSVRIECIPENERVQKLLKKIAFNETGRIFEYEIRRAK